MNTEFTRERKQDFCRALVENNGQRIAACRAIGVSRSTVSRHYQDDPEFRSMYDEAMEEYRELLQLEAHRRAVVGTEKPVYFQGRRAVDTDPDTGREVPAYIREYDTPLLILLLKRHVPAFKDKTIVENHNVNVDMGLKDMESMTPEQRAKLRELLETEDQPSEPEQPAE